MRTGEHAVMLPKTGFLGMGIMGRAMAENILKAGYELMVFNRTPEKTAALSEAGARVAASQKEIADWAEIIIIMVTDMEAIDDLLSGVQGLLAGEIADKTVINMSTVSPHDSKKLAERLQNYSATFIDAPVSGSKTAAEEGELIILAGGPKEKITELEPLFLSMGKKVVYCGDTGQGNSMKMTVNLLLGIMMEGLCEAVNFGQTCGLSVEAMFDTILSGTLACPLFHLKAEMLRDNFFPPQFPLKYMAKDLRFALDVAEENGAAIPVGRTITHLFNQALAESLDDMDFAVVKKVLEDLSD
jgi:3-hydroxyisobutyrate dehydrogenase-like beta-hydroxyacid dehydrogenase